jgi:hypothetical protein
MAMKQHFVTFCSPGTFVPETTELPIKSWDVKAAMKMAHGIVERYAATPYGFYFTTRGRSDKELDSRTTEKSGFYWLGGVIETLEELEKRNDPKDKILLSNMRINGIKKIVTNDNSWRFRGELHDDATVLDWKPRKRRKKAA